MYSRIQAYFFCNAPQKFKLSQVAPCCICAPQSHRLKIRCPTRVPNMANWTACARRSVGNEAGGPAANQCKTMCSTWPTKSKWTHLYGFGRFPLQISDTCFLLIWFRNRNMKKKHHGRVARAVQQMILKGLRIKSNRYGFATIWNFDKICTCHPPNFANTHNTSPSHCHVHHQGQKAPK